MRVPLFEGIPFLVGLKRETKRKTETHVFGPLILGRTQFSAVIFKDRKGCLQTGPDRE